MSIIYTPWAFLPSKSALSEERNFLVRHSFRPDGYCVQVTDTNVVWTEQLDRRRIIGRALDEDTAIDPSEDATQLSLLLNHIRDALSSGRPSQFNILDISRGTLHAEATSKLPAPLKDLRWPFRLGEVSGCTVGTELAAPLISLSYFRTKQMDFLLQSLQQKDNAIDKLLEKVEAAGIDLGIIFPTTAGVRKNRHPLKRAQVLQQIQGLKPFETHDWQSAGSEIPLDHTSLDVTIRKAMEGMNVSKVQDLITDVQANFRIRPKRRGVETDEEGDTTMDIDESAPRHGIASAQTRISTVQASDSPPDAEFQRQATPPSLAHASRSLASPSPAKRRRQLSPGAAETTASPQRVKHEAALSPQPPPIPYSSKPVPPSPAQVQTTNTPMMDLDDGSTTDDDDLDAPYVTQTSRRPSKPAGDAALSASQTSQSIPSRARTSDPPAAPTSPSRTPEAVSHSEPAPKPTPQKTRLGGLGARRAGARKDTVIDEAGGEANSRSDSAAQLLEPGPTVPPTTTPPRTKLGRLGGNLHRHASPTSPSVAATVAEPIAGNDADGVTQAVDRSEETPSHRESERSDGAARAAGRQRETSLERANRKREELKQQLAEQQKKAAGAKKKRRF